MVSLSLLCLLFLFLILLLLSSLFTLHCPILLFLLFFFFLVCYAMYIRFRALGQLADKMTLSQPPPTSTPESLTPNSNTSLNTPQAASTNETMTTNLLPNSNAGGATPESGYSTPALATLTEGLGQMLVRTSSTHRMMASLVIGHWGQCPRSLLPQLTAILTETATYEEILPFLMIMQRECHVSICTYLKVS